VSNPGFDIVVVGGGPGGYVAALRAAQLGAKVAVVERDALGGICLNWGCIPTKALLHAAETWRGLQHADALGLKVEGASFDFARVMKRSRDVAGTLSRGVQGLLAKHKIKVFHGLGRLLGDGGVKVAVVGGDHTEIHARHIVVATGARPRELPGICPDGRQVWNSRHALSAQRLPGSMLVVGAGAIGMEFASFYGTFGTKVTVIEALDNILPQEDAEVCSHVLRAYQSQGIQIRTGVRLKEMSTTTGGVVAVVDGAGDQGIVRSEVALIAIGVVGNVENMGLEKTKVVVEQGRIVADAFGATADSRVHAVGDVTGAPWLAHRAMHQGVACVERIMGLPVDHALRMEDFPRCTYGHPQTASLGLTEQAAKESGLNFKVGRFPLVGNGKAVALGETDGFIKTLVDSDTGEILGAHMVGPTVTELIGCFGVARTLEATDEALSASIWPHPTLSESLHESILAASARALHI